MSEKIFRTDYSLVGLHLRPIRDELVFEAHTLNCNLYIFLTFPSFEMELNFLFVFTVSTHMEAETPSSANAVFSFCRHPTDFLNTQIIPLLWGKIKIYFKGKN